MAGFLKTFVLLLLVFQISCANDSEPSGHLRDLKRYGGQALCKKATPNQVARVNLGNNKKVEFMANCMGQTANSSWCDQIIRPNPDSYSMFQCTYGADQVHQLINPDKTTWKFPIEAVKIVQELEKKSIAVCLIYNWWRPEPYNANVSGSASRHPHGTAVDVRFCSMLDMENGFVELCKMRKAGRIRAVGYYGSTALHIGVGDTIDNTWGKACPN